MLHYAPLRFSFLFLTSTAASRPRADFFASRIEVVNK
jgi:hypothetical protein